MSNHMPSDRQNFVVLVEDLLHFVFADIRHTCADGFVNLLGGMRLRHRTEQNILRISSRSFGRFRLFLLNRFDIFRYRSHSRRLPASSGLFDLVVDPDGLIALAFSCLFIV